MKLHYKFIAMSKAQGDMQKLRTQVKGYARRQRQYRGIVLY